MCNSYNYCVDHMISLEYCIIVIATTIQEYTTDMAIMFSGYMTINLVEWMQEVRKKHDPIASLNALKSTYFRTF